MSGDKVPAKSICFVGIENLLVLAPEYQTHGIGGAQLQQTLLARALVRNGFSVSMVVANYGQADGASWDGITTYRAYRIDAGIRGLRLIHPRATSIWSAMKRAKADIYYSSCADYLPGVLALFAQIHDRKTVFRVAHDTDCQPDKLLIPNWRGKALYKYGIARTDLILAQSATQRGDMLKNFKRDSIVIPSLVDPGSAERSFAERDIEVQWVGNIRAFKRPNLALDLAQMTPELHVHLIGGVDERSPDDYETTRARAATIPNVVFHGPKPYDEVEERLTRTRVFINTSDSEGFPNTYMQAWARGTPVVAFFDPDGVIARDGLGRAVTSLEEMRAAVRDYVQNPDSWAAASARCRRYVTQRHGTSAIASYVEALSSLLQPPAGATVTGSH